MRSKKVNIIYQYLYQIINSEITDENQKLPTEFELKDQFNISRPTIIKAIDILEEEGLVTRVHGSGVYIKKKSRSTKKKKYDLGLLLPLLGQGEIFRPIADEIIHLARQLNFELIWGGQVNLSKTHETQMNEMLQSYITHGVDGIILAPDEMSETYSETNERIISQIKESGIPLVLLDGDYCTFPNRSEYDLVGIDNFLAGYVITKHYLDQGAERVDFCLFSHSAQTVGMRIKGYVQALIDNENVCCDEWIHEGSPENTAFVKRIVERGAHNIICSNDSFAFKLMRNLNHLGYKVPEDIRISGFDDVEFAHFSHVPLTTMAQPCKELGRVALETLVSRIENPLLSPRKIMLSAKLIIRNSSII